VSEELLPRIRDLIQEDVGNRGLRTDPDENLVSAFAGDFAAACRHLASHAQPVVGIVTGFYIPTAQPPCGETDGPLGAVFLARALVPLGIKVVLITDAFVTPALEAGIGLAGLRKSVPIVTLPEAHQFETLSPDTYWETVTGRTGALTHLISVERVGPSHSPDSLRAQGASAETLRLFEEMLTADHHDRYYTMRGRDITDRMSPAHLLFEAAAAAGVTTIGIGDGGNEIGMGKVPWDVIRRNVPGGGMVASRVATDFLIVCGVSNWGAYGLATGVRLLRGEAPDPGLYDLARERDILQGMVRRGPLVDGVSGEETDSVDGLPFERYAEPLARMVDLHDPPPLAPPGTALPPGSAWPRSGGPDPQFLTSGPVGAAEPCGKAFPCGAGASVRQHARSGQLTEPTGGMAMGFVQANLVVVPRELAFDFLLFCQRNPKPCPLLDVTEPGDPEPRLAAPGADIRTDVPRYRVYRDGKLIDEPADLHGWWRDDLVAFLIGCSFTFENALVQGGVMPRHLEMGCNVPMYRTNIACRPAGVFRGPMVVSMRPMTPAQAIVATRICNRFPRAHGAPVHFGDPAAIGIRDIARPDFGDSVEIRSGEVPVFWACGVTPQAVAMEVRPSLMLTHKPGCMFVTDLRDADLEGE